MNFKIIVSAFILLTLPLIASAQIASGGSFTLEKSVVASGGGTSSNGAFTVTGTTAQSAAGTTSSNSPFVHRSGFWIADQIAPTAAEVSISGSVVTAGGAGIRNVVVTLTDSSGASRRVTTGTFGMYRFTNVEVGSVYVLTVTSKKYVFANPSQVVVVNDELTNLDFLADEN
jgi:hypothetical protein